MPPSVASIKEFQRGPSLCELGPVATRPSSTNVTQLRDVEEFSTEETAQILGLSGSAVKSRSRRRDSVPRAVEPRLSTTEITRDQICETFSGPLESHAERPVLHGRRSQTNAIVNQAMLESSLSTKARFELEAVGIAISRYGLVLVLLLIGLLKFT